MKIVKSCSNFLKFAFLKDSEKLIFWLRQLHIWNFGLCEWFRFERTKMHDSFHSKSSQHNAPVDGPVGDRVNLLHCLCSNNSHEPGFTRNVEM